MGKPLVIFRADGSSEIGLGHVIRSAALAEMLGEEFRCVLLRRHLPDALLPELERVYAEVIALPEIVREGVEEAAYVAKLAGELAVATHPPIVVLDGYHFGTAYQRVIKGAGLKLVCIDDIHAYEFVADVVVNHAPGVAPFYEDLLSGGRLCGGLDYALLRSPFLRAAAGSAVAGATETGKIGRVLICLGGSDKLGLSARIVRQLLSGGADYQLTVISGAAAAGGEELAKLATDRPTLRLLHNLSAEQMAEEMARADAAILPASSILYEACALRLPTLSGYYVDNQERIYEGFSAAGLIEGLGDLREEVNYAAALPRLAARRTSLRTEQQRQLTGESGTNFLQLFNSMLA